ncbi:Trk system potassium transporter TrkA [Alkaliphilus pronyensis]|uniref:Trk system potassium uptake protein TrkA n=1 Tax=Alkaliphilus pronyensis TaxID=1482732 RepID=A0A6I0FLP7_9FIRM|nr:Trk system potassium transporter TrkA [Alkaliphilus pronyensis]KAB3539043.1 Trk system potassium transporter TrkA [Alkaliphilus pronyensis]
MYVIIVGAGKLGYKLAESFSHVNNNVVIVDTDNGALQRVSNHIDLLTVKANGVKLSVLEELGVKNADLLISVTSSDETNMLICTTAKKLGCKRVIARIRNPEYGNQMDFVKNKLEIDYIANPELETAKEITKYLLKGDAIHMEDFARGKVVMADFRVNSLNNMKGKKLKELEISKPVLIVAISRDGEMIIPHGDTELTQRDIIYVIGEKENINTFSKFWGAPVERKHVKKAMILGGGKAGFYLARKLIASGVSVKIIERNKERCKYLVEELNNALVIQGDATDQQLILDENISDMDALILLTGYDEENLLLSLLGKKYGVSKVIAKVSRPNYIPIIEQLGIDVAINPIMITAGGILRYVQGGKVESISMLLGGQAEVLEIIAPNNSKVIGVPLSKLELPKGIIIGAIVDNGKVTIPNGNSIINPGNRLVVFCLQSEISSLDKYFYRTKGGLLDELQKSFKGLRKSASI